MTSIERSRVPFGKWSRLPDVILHDGKRPPTPGELVEVLEVKWSAGSSCDDAHDGAAERHQG